MTEPAVGWVIGYDVPNHAVYVVLEDGSPLNFPVRVPFNSSADQMAISQNELPRKGTAGLIIFVNNDYRNGFWLGSYYPTLQNAVTSDVNSPFENLHRHWSGAFEYQQENGDTTHYFPDGSYIRIGTDTTIPQLYRNILQPVTPNTNLEYTVEREEVTLSSTVSNVPPPFSVYYKSASGAIFYVDTSGNVSISVPQSSTFDVTGNGTTIKIDASGNVIVTLATGSTTQINGEAFHAALAELVAQWASTHNHIDSMGGTTTPPVQPITETTIGSTVLETGS